MRAPYFRCAAEWDQSQSPKLVHMLGGSIPCTPALFLRDGEAVLETQVSLHTMTGQMAPDKTCLIDPFGALYQDANELFFRFFILRRRIKNTTIGYVFLSANLSVVICPTLTSFVNEA